MITPLYKNADHPAKELGGHKGLWFERFFNRYGDGWKVANEQKQKWIDTVKGNCGDDAVLQSNAINQQQLCSDLGGQSQTYKNNWHFVTGIGNNHPVENGFTWHATLGTPYLSGASVKGLIRSWMEQWSGLEDSERREKLYFWFGSEDKKADKYNDQKETQAGAFIFFDAIPVESVKLGCDIMTPHMGEWYSKGENITASNYNEVLPADWHNPIPIPFLVVKDATFQFCIAPRPHTKSTKEDIEEIMQVLAMALEYLGAGAKTATGYGRFEINKKAIQDLQEERTIQKKLHIQQSELKKAQSQMSKLAGDFFAEMQTKSWKTDKVAFTKPNEIEVWMEKLGESKDKQLAQQIEELLETHFKGIINNPSKVKGKKNKAAYPARMRKIVAILISTGLL